MMESGWHSDTSEELDAPRCLRTILAEQLEHGEIPGQRWLRESRERFLRYPLISAQVHDALAVFDPRSLAFEPAVIARLASRDQGIVQRLAGEIRHGIRCFLRWQENNDGSFGRGGRCGTARPDPDTTACAALALVEGSSGSSAAFTRRRDRVEVLLGVCEPCEVSVVALANGIRYLLRAGGDSRRSCAALAHRLGAGGADPYSGYAVPEMQAYALGRLYREERSVLAPAAWAHIIQTVSSLTDRGQETSCPLAASLLLSALTDFEQLERIPDATRKVQAQQGEHAWPLRPFLSNECGSPALTTASALSSLLRCRALAGSN